MGTRLLTLATADGHEWDGMLLKPRFGDPARKRLLVIVVGVGIAASQLALVKKSNAAEGAKVAIGDSKIEVRRTICTHCSVGCAVDAVVENGVWVRQEPVFDSPM